MKFWNVEWLTDGQIDIGQWAIRLRSVRLKEHVLIEIFNYNVNNNFAFNF